MRQIEIYAIAIGQIAGLPVTTIIDRITFEPGFNHLADDVRKAQAASTGRIETGFGHRNPFRVEIGNSGDGQIRLAH